MREISYIFLKVGLILKESYYLIRKYKVYFLIPIFLMFAFIAFLVFYLGPAVVVSFIYAGV